MDVRDKVVRAVKTDTPRNKATSLSSVRTKRPHKLSDDIRDKVLKAVEGGMTCRQAAAHCGVSLASAIRLAKRAGVTDKRAKAKVNVRDMLHPVGKEHVPQAHEPENSSWPNRLQF
jgi:DNA-binding MurR/RpiR family transcriptional regulator